jgi:hypothetical protein
LDTGELALELGFVGGVELGMRFQVGAFQLGEVHTWLGDFSFAVFIADVEKSPEGRAGLDRRWGDAR